MPPIITRAGAGGDAPWRCRPSSGCRRRRSAARRCRCSAVATLSIAVICGTPTPATMRVVQIEPGPMPTLTPSAPASTSASAAAPVAMLPPITSTLRIVALDPAHAVEHALAVAVRGVDDERVDAGLDQQLDPLLGALAHADRGADAQLARAHRARRAGSGLLGDVLDRDQPAQFEGVVDHQHAARACACASAPWRRRARCRRAP